MSLFIKNINLLNKIPLIFISSFLIRTFKISVLIKIFIFK